IYKADAPYTLIEGYPKTLKEELGIEGRVDAAFVCPAEHTVHIIQGGKLHDIDLTATPRVVTQEWPLPLTDIDAGTCDANGIKVFKGSQYYSYASPMILATARINPEPEIITKAMMGCQD
ncbi:hypothetical protein ACIKK6_24405, partial [Bacillus thuringiensis]